MAGGATVLRLSANEQEFVASLQRASGALGKFAANLNITVARAYQEADRQQTQFNRGLLRVSNSLKSISLKGFVGLSLPLLFAANSAKDAYAEFDSLKRGLQSLDPSIANVNARVKELEQLARLPALGFQEALKADVRMRTVGFTISESTRIMREFSNAVAKTGGGSANLGEITHQLSQMAAKSKVLSQDLRPIIENAPAVAGALKTMFGTVSADEISTALQAKGKSSMDFIRDLLTEMEKGVRVSGGFRVAMENLSETIFRIKARILEKYDAMFDLTGMIGSLESAANGLFEQFNGLPEPMQKVIAGAVVMAGTFPLVTYAISKMIDVFVMLSRNMMTKSGLIGVLITALALLGVAFYTATQDAKEFAHATRGLNEIEKEVSVSTKDQTDKMFALIGALEKAKVGSEEYKNIKSALLAMNPAFADALKGNTVDYLKLSQAAGLYAEQLANVARQQAYSNQITANTEKLGKLDKDLESLRKGGGTETIPFVKNMKLAFTPRGFSKLGSPIIGAGTFTQNQIEYLESQKADLERANKKYQDELTENIAKNGELAKQLMTSTETPTKGGGVKSANKEEIEEKTKALAKHNKEVEQFAIQRWKRIEAIEEEQHKAYLALTKEQNEEVLKAKELTNKQLADIDKMYANQKDRDLIAKQKYEAGIKTHFENILAEETKYQAQLEQLRAKEREIAENRRANEEAMLNEAIFQTVAGGISQMLNEETDGLNRALRTQLRMLGDYAIRLGVQALKIVKLKAALMANPTPAAALGFIAAGVAMKGLANSIQVNRLAKGGMTNGNAIFSILGDNPSGKEMALPWERTSEFAQQIAKKMGGTGGAMDIAYTIRARDIKLTLNRLEQNG